MRSKTDELGNSVIDCGDVKIGGFFKGRENTVKIGPSPNGPAQNSALRLHIFGSGNIVNIGAGAILRDLSIAVGSASSAADNVAVFIGEKFSCEPDCSFLLYNSRNRLEIGNNCMFSRNITLRCGELPHLLFDAETGEYLDGANAVKIGNHVWIGENAYLTKRCSVADGCVVGAHSVVSRRFERSGCVIAGNPATIVKERVKWFRNKSFLPKDSIFEKSWLAYLKGEKLNNDS